MYVTAYIDNTKYGLSSLSFAHYLEKEALLQEEISEVSSKKFSSYLDKQNDLVRTEGREYFFNGTGDRYDSEQVTKAIDANVKGLKRSEARYYTFSISPSAQEIDHLRRRIADTRQALLDAGETVPDEYAEEMMRRYLKQYAVACMDAYAQNFGHSKIHSNEDLLWFGMVERDRYWKNRDREVKQNRELDKQIQRLQRNPKAAAKIRGLEKQYIRECDVRAGGSRELLRPMMPKAGDNWHIHVSVSRRDITNRFNLSPNANTRQSRKHRLNGQCVRVGFDREEQKINCEKIFDQMFAHERLQTESYEEAKQLRQQSPEAFWQQRVRDIRARKAQQQAYLQLHAAGYNDYQASLLNQERLDARQLRALKSHVIRQIRASRPQLDVRELQEYSLEELQQELMQVKTEAEFTPIGGLSARLADRTIQISGLQYSPVSTTRRILKQGLMINRAVELRRETLERWYSIYQDNWFRENYLYDSIADRIRTERLLVEAEFIRARQGSSPIIAQAEAFVRQAPKEQAEAVQKLLDTVDLLSKEEALLRLGQEIPELKEALYDWKGSVDREVMREAFQLGTQRQQELEQVIENFITQELSDYAILVEKQSQLEQLLREIEPDRNRAEEWIREATAEIEKVVEPYYRQLFETEGHCLFGQQVFIHNEQEFSTYLREHSLEAAAYEKHAGRLFARIEERRKEAVQRYVRERIQPAQLQRVRHGQRYINRYIDRHGTARQIKERKEALQRLIEAACHRKVLPAPAYRVFDLRAQKQITQQAMVKAQQVKLLSVSPQQLMFKAATKILKVLTNGYSS